MTLSGRAVLGLRAAAFVCRGGGLGLFFRLYVLTCHVILLEYQVEKVFAGIGVKGAKPAMASPAISSHLGEVELFKVANAKSPLWGFSFGHWKMGGRGD